MRKIGLFFLGLVLMAPAFSGTASAQKKGPNFQNLLKVTAPNPNQKSEGEMTPEEKAEKEKAYNQMMEDKRMMGARQVQGYDEELHGYMRYGGLICEDGYYKTPDGSKCERPTPVENGRWKNGRLLCDHGFIQLVYLDGRRICDGLPAIENAFYHNTKLECISGYAPVGKECVPVNEINSTEEVTRHHNWCSDLYGFEERSGACYEREDKKPLQAGYGGGVGGGDTDGGGLNLNPYDTR